MTVNVQQRGTAAAVEPRALSSNATSRVSATPYIVQAAQKYRPNDPTFPLVVLAIAEGEGGLTLPTPAGDNGTSFGPFQLHEGGALPAGKGEAWANSPAGIDYAVRQIALVTQGSTGEQAISRGVTEFERPAAPKPEISRDVAWYRQQGARGGPPGFVPPDTLPNPGGALGTGSGTLPPAKYTPGMFDCSGTDSFLFGLIKTPSTGAIGCYMFGALKLVGMAVIGSGLALAGFYLLLPRRQSSRMISLIPGAGLAAAGAQKATGTAGGSPPAAAPVVDEHAAAIKAERVKQARARTSKARADARAARHKAAQAKLDTGATYKLSPNTEAALARAARSPRRGRPDRMSG